MNIEIENGRIFVDGNETVDPEYIGYAMLDFAESTQGDNYKLILKEGDAFEVGCAKCTEK